MAGTGELCVPEWPLARATGPQGITESGPEPPFHPPAATERPRAPGPAGDRFASACRLERRLGMTQRLAPVDLAAALADLPDLHRGPAGRLQLRLQAPSFAAAIEL